MHAMSCSRYIAPHGTPSLCPSPFLQAEGGQPQQEVDGPPQALVTLAKNPRDRFFHVVQRIKRPAKRPGHIAIRCAAGRQATW